MGAKGTGSEAAHTGIARAAACCELPQWGNDWQDATHACTRSHAAFIITQVAEIEYLLPQLNCSAAAAAVPLHMHRRESQRISRCTPGLCLHCATAAAVARRIASQPHILQQHGGIYPRSCAWNIATVRERLIAPHLI